MARAPDIQQVARRDGRYHVEAYQFIRQALRQAAKTVARGDGGERHLAASELTGAVLDLAAERFGLLGALVLRGWGLRRSEDIGVVTFTLIEAGIFTKQPGDRIEDFTAGPVFTEAVAERVRTRLVG
jgi:uncharacterized repeat protein (TIGR04138 family)